MASLHAGLPTPSIGDHRGTFLRARRSARPRLPMTSLKARATHQLSRSRPACELPHTLAEATGSMLDEGSQSTSPIRSAGEIRTSYKSAESGDASCETEQLDGARIVGTPVALEKRPTRGDKPWPTFPCLTRRKAPPTIFNACSARASRLSVDTIRRISTIPRF